MGIIGPRFLKLAIATDGFWGAVLPELLFPFLIMRFSRKGNG